MAVNLFKLTINGTEYIYTDAGTWVDSKGTNVTAPAGIVVPTNETTKNSDGTRDVTVNKAAFSTIDSKTTIALEDMNAVDRQTYRLALGSGYTSNEIYGARQTVNYSTSGVFTTATITGINAGLLVNAGGTSITYANAPTGASASVVISNLASTDVNISGRTITVKEAALPTNNAPVKITTNDSSGAYNLALGEVTGKISTFTQAGWSVGSNSTTAVFYADSYTAGYYKANDTLLSYHSTDVYRKTTGTYDYGTVGGSAELFRVSGLSAGTTAAQLVDHFDVNTSNVSGNIPVTFKASGFSALLGSGSKAITIADSPGDSVTYQFAIDSGVNTIDDSLTTSTGSNTSADLWRPSTDTYKNDMYINKALLEGTYDKEYVDSKLTFVNVGNVKYFIRNSEIVTETQLIAEYRKLTYGNATYYLKENDATYYMQIVPGGATGKDANGNTVTNPIIIDNKGDLQTEPKPLSDSSHNATRPTKNPEEYPDDDKFKKKITNPVTGEVHDYRVKDLEVVYKKMTDDPRAFDLSEDSCYSYFQITSLHREIYTYLNVNVLTETTEYRKGNWKVDDMFFVTKRAGWID